MEGRPGDHPVTDMLYHGQSLVDDEIDALLKTLRAYKMLAYVKRFWEEHIESKQLARDEIIRRLREIIEREESYEM